MKCKRCGIGGTICQTGLCESCEYVHKIMVNGITSGAGGTTTDNCGRFYIQNSMSDWAERYRWIDPKKDPNKDRLDRIYKKITSLEASINKSEEKKEVEMQPLEELKHGMMVYKRSTGIGPFILIERTLNVRVGPHNHQASVPGWLIRDAKGNDSESCEADLRPRMLGDDLKPDHNVIELVVSVSLFLNALFLLGNAAAFVFGIGR